MYFNFADCFTELNYRDNEGMSWLATKFDLPILTQWRVGIVDQGVQPFKNPMDLLWYQPNHRMAAVHDLPLDEGHNTLVINPRPRSGDSDSNPDQDPLAKGAITLFQASAMECYATMDLTAAYAQAANKVVREIALVDNRQHIRIHDEIALKEAGEILWFLHINSEASVEIMESGRTAILTIGNKRLQIQLACAEEAKFTVMEAKPLPTSPDPEVQWTYPQWGNPRYREMHQPKQKLAIHLMHTQKVALTILIIPFFGEHLLH
ncbi:hypothetical protein ASG89_22365 [Paenibacillus sp. Soil766]|uniref:heparinase II/III domain-containing protein n=1 Tax=Paenibacillus sp. Soil766 TaxID=1736404 RepID=UPI00070C23F9|nr:heparinase II/III family protein [Paenibacillus sp. Soil766]KRF04132.1 hypothetical protein ASG89_22365 [Paenibacillus sp. Soil766]